MIKYINNKIVKISALMLSIVVLSVSCDDFLDQQPISEIGPKNFWKNNTDAASGVAAIYDGMQATYGDQYFLWGEFRADNFIQSSAASATQNLSELVLQNLSDGNNSALRWNNLYNMINRANQAIKNIPNITAYDKNLLAEAYALRAFAYFDAVRVWGSVPLFIEPTEGTQGIQKPRTDGTTIMNEVIIPDMLKAEQLMSNFSSDFRFSKASILCMQAEVYMWLKDYAKAKKAIDKMIALGEHSLVKTVKDWENLFYNNLQVAAVPDGQGKIQVGPELIFSIRYDLGEERDNPGQTFANRSGIMGLFFAGIPSFYISPVLERKWQDKFPIDSLGWVTKYPGVAPAVNKTVTYTDENGQLKDSLAPVYGDWRYFSCREGGYQSFGSRGIGEARMQKWNQTNYNRNYDDTDIVIYRYAGMLLLLAEAENQLGNSSVALNLVNQVRAARQLPLVKSAEFGATIDAREDYILEERQLELLGEGKRWWDLRRTDKALEVLNPILDTIVGATQLTNERLLFPVFIDHLIENPLLEQNSGY
ncbi:RagB/SusD family nutrient uptake outer membrane protein [Lutibacter sp. HS1-25]|uniref:RagB/SusD family nutrient uptake outer membrane protein n=1 Tax=Lutibacter sp. HS1-25 TaxID=2485000 RepID=UPI0010103E59|nr:RagB/SusD family nutrient uptake outer membrane protein [Lutibacter sp. HS1-25]RXP62743.1 RagB/SusD family nutrient uptake outer membrane protein [Lutibacter sp. HS1-25]